MIQLEEEPTNTDLTVCQDRADKGSEKVGQVYSTWIPDSLQKQISLLNMVQWFLTRVSHNVTPTFHIRHVSSSQLTLDTQLSTHIGQWPRLDTGHYSQLKGRPWTPQGTAVDPETKPGRST